MWFSTACVELIFFLQLHTPVVLRGKFGSSQLMKDRPSSVFETNCPVLLSFLRPCRATRYRSIASLQIVPGCMEERSSSCGDFSAADDENSLNAASSSTYCKWSDHEYDTGSLPLFFFVLYKKCTECAKDVSTPSTGDTEKPLPSVSAAVECNRQIKCFFFARCL